MSLLDQGLQVMLYGMGTVFIFLAVLVLATGALSRVVQRIQPQTVNDDGGALDSDLLKRRQAAAVAAVHRHRQLKR